jgi:hypothetical protein
MNHKHDLPHHHHHLPHCTCAQGAATDQGGLPSLTDEFYGSAGFVGYNKKFQKVSTAHEMNHVKPLTPV